VADGRRSESKYNWVQNLDVCLFKKNWPRKMSNRTFSGRINQIQEGPSCGINSPSRIDVTSSC